MSLIDEVDDIMSIDTSGVAWILVVEKEVSLQISSSESEFF